MDDRDEEAMLMETEPHSPRIYLPASFAIAS
jgi:hypothetical protein